MQALKSSCTHERRKCSSLATSRRIRVWELEIFLLIYRHAFNLTCIVAHGPHFGARVSSYSTESQLLFLSHLPLRSSANQASSVCASLHLTSADVRTAPEMAPSVLPYEPALLSNDAFETLLVSLKPITSQIEPNLRPDQLVSRNPFFDSLRTPELRVHEATLNPTPETANLTLTDNLGVTNASTLSPTLELFNELGSVQKDGMRKLLEAAWRQDPLSTLKVSSEPAGPLNPPKLTPNYCRSSGALGQSLAARERRRRGPEVLPGSPKCTLKPSSVTSRILFSPSIASPKSARPMM